MHKRSDFNKFIDGCPEWVQNEIWGDSGMLSKIERQQALIEQQEKRIAELKCELNECKVYLIATQRGKDKLAATVARLRIACQLGIDMFVSNDINVPNTIETMQDAIGKSKRRSHDKTKKSNGR